MLLFRRDSDIRGASYSRHRFADGSHSPEHTIRQKIAISTIRSPGGASNPATIHAATIRRRQQLAYIRQKLASVLQVPMYL
jgi:hypothetical protein